MPEPLDMLEEVSRLAAADAGCDGILPAVERLRVVHCHSWSYDDLPGRLCARLGLAPADRSYSGIGGTTPQVLVQELAASMLRGEHDLALVAGAEALDTLRLLAQEERRPGWSHAHPDPPPLPVESARHPSEVAHGLSTASLPFSFFDLGRRAARGVEPDPYRESLGALLSSMTHVAAANPDARFPVARTPAEIITPTAANRWINYPYTKQMVAVMNVDMAAAVVLATHAKADELGVPADRRVYLRGWGQAMDPVHVAERPSFSASAAMRASGAAALRAAGIGVDDLAHLDLYSCFTSAVNLGRDALGIDDRDPRQVTVTGGLPYFGGPASNYMTHALASMARALRDDPGAYGLVSGVGMYMTAHVHGVYSTEPGPIAPADPSAVQAETNAAGHHPIVGVHRGPATIATYGLVHGRDGERRTGLAVCDVPGGRCYARILDDELLAEAQERELVGRTVELVDGGEGVNVAVAP